jgi:voltage-gated potassium channel Kch
MKQGRQTQAYRNVGQPARKSASVRRTREPVRTTFVQRFRYRMDNAFSRGPMAIIVWLASMTVAIVVVAALFLAAFRVRINDKNVGFIEGFWQSMLRVIDPGTMGGDNGWGLRVTALLVTISGIFLASALIGIIASAIDTKVQDLRRGRSFVVEHAHTLILGWSPRIFTVISELCVANENQSDACIVVMADVEKTEMEEQLRTRVGTKTGTRIVCRTGEPASLHDLGIVNAARARAIVVLGAVDEPGGDAEMVKAVLATLVTSDQADVPIVVEIGDAETAAALREAGAGRVHCVRAADVIARITAQACRQSGLSVVCQELLDFDGDEIYFHVAPELEGRIFGEALLAFETSTVIGIRTADGVTRVNPPMETRFGAGDAVIAISADDDTIAFAGFLDESAPDVQVDPEKDQRPQRILVVGWSPLGSVVLDELDEFVPPGSTVDVLVDEDLVEMDESDVPRLDRLEVAVVSARSDLEMLGAQVEGHEYDHVILLGYRGDLSPSESDARTLLTMLLLQRSASGIGRVVAEILDSRDVELAQATGADDFIVSDALSSYMMAQLAENPELDDVFTDLFDAEGSAIGVKPADWYVRPDAPVSFVRVAAAARARSEIAIGYRLAARDGRDAEVVVNPANSETVHLGVHDRVVVIGPPE